MIPLLILGLLISAGVATYELSPRAHTWVDDHVAALRALFGALRAGNEHVDAARAAADPAVAVQQAQAAEAARANAAQQASIAAATAKTAEQREAAARSAAAVDQLTAAVAALKGFIAGAWQGMVSPHTHAMHQAHVAHTAADSHLATASAQITAPKAAPEQPIAHVKAADVANKDAAAASATAAATATTPEEHQVATQSAQIAVDRDKKITSVFADLGVGICGVRSYAGVSSKIRDALIAKLREAGMAVTAKKPSVWDIDTGILGIKLRAAWDARGQELKLIVTGGSSALCDLIWQRVDPKMKEARAAR